MSATCDRPLAPHENPFRVARVEALGYRHETGGLAELAAQLEARGMRGALVGPHGSGKSTLLRELGAHLDRSGWRTTALSLGEARPATREGLRAWLAEADERTVLLVDGAEQLGPLAWRRVRRTARGAGGIVITTHRPGRLPTLREHRTDLSLLRALIDELVGDPSLREALEPFAEAAFARARGDVRRALRELYDRVADGIPAHRQVLPT